ncbi:MAG: hypothetical protein Q9207_006338, partial [Kuettlingeria erythrocarpa]
MGDLLVPIKTTAAHSKGEREDRHRHSVYDAEELQSLEQALEVLRSRPQRQVLLKVLQSISGALDIHSHTPLTSQIIHVLVNDIIPDHWSDLTDDKSGNGRKTKGVIVQLLSGVGGVSAIATRMRLLISTKVESSLKSQLSESGRAALLADLLSLLELVLGRDDFLSSVWLNLNTSLSEPQRRWLLWKELITLLGNGRVLSTASEADLLVARGSPTIHTRSWISHGIEYSAWLGRNLGRLIEGSSGTDAYHKKAWAQMLERATSLGHTDQVVEATYDQIVYGNCQSIGIHQAYTCALSSSAKRSVVFSLLRTLTKTHLSAPSVISSNEETKRSISAVAALLCTFTSDHNSLSELLLEWLDGDGISQDLLIRRAVIAALTEDIDALKTALSNSLRAFGDKISIQHTPIIRQEGTTENLLLLAGYVYRKEPQHISHMARSSVYLNAISNRLAASSARQSVLGMYVGTAISELVDPPNKRMKFSSDELTNAEAHRYISLPRIQDSIGSTQTLKRKNTPNRQLVFRGAIASAIQQVPRASSSSQVSKESRIISIEEVESESDAEENDDLPTYAKPDSDASDSDDDPTVINRDKPTAPVYINDLISGLRDTENYDRHSLALSHASSLIRRKASFGSEVTDNAQELASILTGVQDKWDISNFEELRLQGMIAVLVAQPLEMGQWFSATYFNGDYSISQRAAVLTTLGLGARELAGYGKEDAALTKSNQDTSLPSKKLPPKLHALYASSEMEPITAASAQLEQSILRPMALNAADALSGPNALKIRTFSSRMDVEKKRTRPIPNALAKVVADGFFFPLTGRFSMHTQG